MAELTRETLAEIRRLQALEAGRFFLVDAAPKPADGRAQRKHDRRRSEWAAAHQAYRAAIMTNLDALLAAAERGLDAEGGR